MTSNSVLPQWAPRLPQAKISRLYENDALGIYDDELINEIGYALWARCQSFLETNQAARGEAPCPACGSIIRHSSQKEEILRCSCSWELSWGEYFKTFQHKQLSGAEPVIEFFVEFIERFPKAGSARERMFLIDRLLHGFHWYQVHTPTRPVAINLIEGSLNEVVAFLESLTYGAGSTPGVQENRVEWEKNLWGLRSWGKEKT